MSLRLPGGRRWLGLALLAPGLLLLSPGTAAAQQPKSTKKIKPTTQIQPIPETQPKVVPSRPGSTPRSSSGAGSSRGQAVAQPRGAQSAVAATAARAGGGAEPAKGPGDSCIHVVRSGETLSRVAVRHRVSQAALASANQLARPSSLRAGQRLTVPGCRVPADDVVETATSAGPRDSQAASVEPLSVNSEFLVARVGPRRIPTRLYVAIPEFTGDEVEFAWPIDGPVLSGFGRRRGGWHAGVDIRAERGTPIRAAAPGVVIFSGWETYYGKLVKVEHQNGFITLYAHNHENLVQVGDQVDADTVLATVGRTGRATGDHLHFEIRRNGMAYNPTHLLDLREMPTVVATPYLPPEPDQVPVSALSPDDIDQP